MSAIVKRNFTCYNCYMGRANGFTLIEVMVVVVIIGILAGISVVSYRHTREKTIDREASASLALIQSAERQYFVRTERYWPPSTTNITNLAHINGNLSLDLNARSWTFSVQGNAAGSDFTAQAMRAGRTWRATRATGPQCVAGCI